MKMEFATDRLTPQTKQNKTKQKRRTDPPFGGSAGPWPLSLHFDALDCLTSFIFLIVIARKVPASGKSVAASKSLQ